MGANSILGAAVSVSAVQMEVFGQSFLVRHEELCPIHVESESALYQTAHIIGHSGFVHYRDNFQLHSLGRNKQNGFGILFTLQLDLGRNETNVVAVHGLEVLRDLVSKLDALPSINL